jgi:small subunit ribosomal protein S20
MRQSQARRLKNRHYRTRMRTQLKTLDEAISSGDKAAAKAQFDAAVAIIQRNAQKGIIHKRQANRRVSRLAKRLNSIG